MDMGKIKFFEVALCIPGLAMTTVTVIHCVSKVALYVSTAAVNRRLVTG
jgi:hypothetical protein